MFAGKKGRTGKSPKEAPGQGPISLVYFQVCQNLTDLGSTALLPPSYTASSIFSDLYVNLSKVNLKEAKWNLLQVKDYEEVNSCRLVWQTRKKCILVVLQSVFW
jgi:hypothetical protein